MIGELFAVLTDHTLFALGSMLLVGYAFGMIAERLHLPEITGFILAGLIVGPYGAGLVGPRMAADLQLLTQTALSIIAFTVGSTLHRDTLRRVGKSVAIIAGGHTIVGFLAVTLLLLIVGLPPAVAMLMGVVAGATSPGTTVAVIRSLKARGPFVDTLYGVVAVVNATAIVFFGIMFSFVPLLLGSSAVVLDPWQLLLGAFSDIGVSIGLGSLAGLVLHFATRRQRSDARFMIKALGILFSATAAAISMGNSPLLVNMVTGLVYTNLNTNRNMLFRALDGITPPLYALFFVLAGAKLNPSVLLSVSMLGLGAVYSFSRVIGSYVGVSLGSRLSGAPVETARYLGLCLVPQAGVALGLVLLIENAPMIADLAPASAALLSQSVDIVLLAIFIKEMLGPPLSRYAIARGAHTG